MLQSFSDDFLPKYELEIEQYYRKLSEEQGQIPRCRTQVQLTARAAVCFVEKYPQGDSNPCRRRERAVSWASRRWGRLRRCEIVEGEGASCKLRLIGQST